MSDSPTRVLLVDDDPAMLRLLTRWLESAGYHVDCATDGNEACDAINRLHPQILVTDWEMPQMDGLELCGWLRRQSLPHYLYTIILTVRTKSEDIVSGLQAGADDFIRKPVDKTELLARLAAGRRVVELESHLSSLAKSDPLTGLATQRTLYEHMDAEFSRATRYNLDLSCVMIDVDFFKRINDTLGHMAGDYVLRCVAKLLEENCRSSDVVSRYGGEEFCILLPETSEKEAAIWAERMRRVISDTKITVDGKMVSVTASFGVAQRLADTNTPEELIDLADQALLIAKRAGRDRTVSFKAINAAAEIKSRPGGPAEIFGNLQARDVMTTVVAGLNQNQEVGHAAQYFLRFRINSAPVVDDDGKLVGILGERDVMSIMLWPEWWQTRIKDVMKKNVVCYDEDSPVLSIYEFLTRVSIRGVVIVSDERPTGVISRGSLLRWFVNSQSVRQLALADHETPGQINAPAQQDESLKPRERLALTAQALADEADNLQNWLGRDGVDLVPYVVGGASRMQELVNDLLAYSRYANDASDDQPEREVEFAGLSGLLNSETQQGLAGLFKRAAGDDAGDGSLESLASAWLPADGQSATFDGGTE